MATLRSATAATPAMKAVLPRFITPALIARDPACLAFAVMEPRFVTGTGSVSQVANLSRPDQPFIQTTVANQPAYSYDAALGRETLTFNPDRVRTLSRVGAADYTGAFSLLTVARFSRTDVVMNLVGDYGASAATASVHVNSTSTLRTKVGDAQAQFLGTIAVGPWYAAIGSYGGTGRVKSKRLDGALSTGGVDVSAEPTTNTLRVGHTTASQGIDGSVDMVALFSVDVLSAGQAELLDRIETMLRQYYGAAVAGGA